MTPRIALAILVSLFLGGCQAAGPGIQVQVRAEPKTGYKPPPPDDVGYGGSDLPDAEAHDHDFHLIDYRRLDQIVVWVEPSAPGSSDLPAIAPIDAAVNLFKTYSGNVDLASVGGRVKLNGPQKSGTYLLRTSAGELIDVPVREPIFEPKKPGIVEVLANDSDAAVATIFVSPTAWAKKAVSGQPANFAPLPPGRYRVTAWHPVLPGSSQIVDVGPEKLSKLTLTVGVNSLPKPK
jgi:hypothetical protein